MFNLSSEGKKGMCGSIGEKLRIIEENVDLGERKRAEKNSNFDHQLI